MKSFLSFLIFLLCSGGLTAYAFTPPPPPADGFLLDQAQVLTTDEAAQLKSKLASINSSSKNEITIYLLNSLDGESIDDVAYQVFNSWKIGKAGKDNGVLLVLAIQEHQIRVETGKGVGGELTDLQTNDIIQQMKPGLRDKHYAASLNIGVDAISSQLEHRTSESKPTVPNYWIWILIGLGVLLYLIIAIATRDPFWGLGLVLIAMSGGKSSGSSSGGFGGGSSGGGGSSDSWD